MGGRGDGGAGLHQPQIQPKGTAKLSMRGQSAAVPGPPADLLPPPTPCPPASSLTPSGLAPAHATPLKSHGAALKHHATPLEARTPVSAHAARSSAGRRPLSADTGTPGPEGPAGAEGGKEDSNPLAFLAIAASMDEDEC